MRALMRLYLYFRARGYGTGAAYRAAKSRCEV